MAQFGIYVHWPFCESKCPYCDFNSHVSKAIDHEAWRRAYRAELCRYANKTSHRTVTSIFFGGGTPSLMAPGTLAEIITIIKNSWPVAKDLEVTIEANPSSAEAKNLTSFRSAGVNRLSLGVQSLEDSTLLFLGRRHTAAEAIEATKIGAQIFERYSIDLIYAWPGQTINLWRQELERGLKLADGHIAAYQLTIEPGTQFYKDKIPAANEAVSGQFFDITQKFLREAGMPAYEISNHARPGQECSHNLVYWRGEDYIGIGPGAHGRLTTIGPSGVPETEAIQEIRFPDKWLKSVQANGIGTQKRTKLSFEHRFDEIVLMGLRLSEGIDTERFLRLTGRRLFDYLKADRLDLLIRGGFLIGSCTNLRLSPDGVGRLDAVIRELLV